MKTLNKRLSFILFLSLCLSPFFQSNASEPDFYFFKLSAIATPFKTSDFENVQITDKSKFKNDFARIDYNLGKFNNELGYNKGYRISVEPKTLGAILDFQQEIFSPSNFSMYSVSWGYQFPVFENTSQTFVIGIKTKVSYAWGKMDLGLAKTSEGSGPVYSDFATIYSTDRLGIKMSMGKLSSAFVFNYSLGDIASKVWLSMELGYTMSFKESFSYYNAYTSAKEYESCTTKTDSETGEETEDCSTLRNHSSKKINFKSSDIVKKGTTTKANLNPKIETNGVYFSLGVSRLLDFRKKN